MSIYDFFLSRNNGPTRATYIGHKGRLFYDDASGEIRLSDGVTPGGLPIPISNATTELAGSVKPGLGLQIASTATISIDATSSFAFAGNQLALLAATDTRLGGVKLGPGVVTNPQGQIIIDSTGLDFNFGDFYAYNGPGADGATAAYLSSTNADEDIVIASNGTGHINLVGRLNIYKTDGDISVRDPLFKILDDGQIEIFVNQLDSNAGALEVIVSSTGAKKPPGNIGGMLHVTGQLNQVNRIYFDGNNNYPSIVGRRWNGTITTSTQLLAGDDVLRINATAQTDTGMPSTATVQIRMYVLENQTLSTQGGAIDFVVTPIGQPATNRLTATTITSTGTRSITFFGPLIGNVTGNADTATKLATPRTINGVSFDGTTNIDVANTQTLTIGTHLTGVSYNGSTAVTIATDATTNATASVLVARDSNGMITAQNYKGNNRDAGTLGAGGTLTVNYATDHIVLVNITGAITIAHSSITAGRVVKVVVVNNTGGNLSVDTGVSNLNTTGGNATGNVNANRMGTYEFISYGTSTTTLYANVNK